MLAQSRLIALFLFASLALAAPAAIARQNVQPPNPRDAVYAALRSARLSGEAASVSNLVIKRDAGTFTLKSGTLYFLEPVEGRVTGAVFVGAGEFSLTPPTENEKRALAIYTKAPTVTETFSELVLRFADGTHDEIKTTVTLQKGNEGVDRAAGILADNESLLRKRLRWNLALRSLRDLYAPSDKGYFAAFIKGDRWSKLIYQVDPYDAEEVSLLSYGETDGGIWTQFRAAGAKPGDRALEETLLYDIKLHDISITIKGSDIAGTSTVTLAPLHAGLRVLPFSLYPTLRVSKVTDAAGAPVPFIQESRDEDAELAVVLPAPTETGKELSLTFEYGGPDAIRNEGGGNFILLPRSTWYPNNGASSFGDRAKFRTTFRLSSDLTIVGTGQLVEPETTEGKTTISKWTSGDVELAVAGFNFGKFKRKEVKDPDTGYTIEFYANKEVPAEIKRMQNAIDQAEAQGIKTMTTLGSINTARWADSALADTQNATRLYNYYFGKLPYGRIAMTQQPAGGFGQAWPTLVYMPYTAFLDSTIRTQMFGIKGGTDSFFKYVGPHEVAHQWWGHLVGWSSYRDQWMSEGFSEFSASLFVQTFVGLPQFIDLWEDHRKAITQARPETEGKAPYTIGPITQGFRLGGAKTGAAYRYLVYPKGAYVLHMLRMMMYDAGKTKDARFIAMMKDFVQTHYNKDVSTEDFKQIVAKHVTPELDVYKDGSVDWFFDQWVYGTEMPSYRLEYSIGEKDGKAVLSGKVTQSGVSDTFVMRVPFYVDFGKGPTRLGFFTLVGNSSQPFSVPLPARPKTAAVNALNDVLCLKNEAVQTN